jgi:hypothetical protein
VQGTHHGLISGTIPAHSSVPEGVNEIQENLRIAKTPGQDSDEAPPRYKPEAQVLDTTYSS